MTIAAADLPTFGDTDPATLVRQLQALRGALTRILGQLIDRENLIDLGACHVLTGRGAPTAAFDIYPVGSLYIDTTAGELYVREP